jgi:hypothetical protein
VGLYRDTSIKHPPLPPTISSIKPRMVKKL